MSRRYGLMLILLALIWGSSFMFIKIAVRELDPATLILGRLALAAVTLGVVVPLLVGTRTTVHELRRHWRALAVVGLLNTALPFWLLSWGETRIDSGLASILQASVPIFNALLAFLFFHDQRVTNRMLAGVAVGSWAWRCSSVRSRRRRCSARWRSSGWRRATRSAGCLTRQYLSDTQPHVVAFGTAAIAAVAVLPFGVAAAPSTMPGWDTLASVAVLGILGTAVAYLLFFTIIAGAGAAYASLVTYLVPPVALAYGAIFLDESVGLSSTRRLVLIFAGVTFGRAHRAAGRRIERNAFRGRLARAVISLRRATLDDVDWLLELLNDEDTEPFLGGRAPRDAEALRAQLERSQAEPEKAGRMIVEVGGERAGTRRSRPSARPPDRVRRRPRRAPGAFRRRGVADEAARRFRAT